MAATEKFEIKELVDQCINVPLSGLRQSAKTKLASYLDQEGNLVNDYTNDWIGLAEIIGFGNTEINMFERFSKPTEALLDCWATREHMSPTIDALIRYLQEIQRPDVVMDCKVNICKYV